MNAFSISKKQTQWITEIRRHLHAFPELSSKEFETSAYICRKLTELGIPFRDSVARTGVVADIGNSNDQEPLVALRADMDALPITERTGLPFSSQHPGIMHACGHDGHVAMLLGAASLLKNTKLPGNVRLIFQPAEENGGGAHLLVSEGVLKGVGAIISGHIDRHLQVGEIAVQNGLICAYTDDFKIEISGKGGHAAKPHETADTILAACSLVTSLQSIVSREINPLYPNVISIGKIDGGSASNVIAEKTVLVGTIRSTDGEVRRQMTKAITRMVKAIQVLNNVEAKVSFFDGYPPVINDAAVSEIVRNAARKIVGEDGVLGLPLPSMGGEDFSFYLKEIPGCFVRFGAKKKGLENAAAHSSYFDFDEDVLPIGARLMAQAAFDYLNAYQHNK
jgi:hippurate hydrolase